MRRMHGEQGFTYLGLIILVTIIGLVGAATLKIDSLLRRAAAEKELLEVGAAFSEALRSYAAVTPRGQPTMPPSLKELLRDPRFPEVRRHLRKVFVDPMTGKGEWGIVYAGDHTGVLAVYSLSDAKPLKVANFDERFHGFENKEHISDWKFTANGQGVVRLDKSDNPLAAQQARKEDAPAAPVVRGQIESRDPPPVGQPGEPSKAIEPAGPREAPKAAEPSDPAEKRDPSTTAEPPDQPAPPPQEQPAPTEAPPAPRPPEEM